MWGATEINDMLAVDPNIPKWGRCMSPVRATIGSIRVNLLVRKGLHRERVCYLAGQRPIAVFVTGSSKTRGATRGGLNSILYFIDRAAGIDPDRGSYRRGGNPAQSEGHRQSPISMSFSCPANCRRFNCVMAMQFLIQPRGNTVSVEGDVRNAAIFELTDGAVDGTSLLAWARPLPVPRTWYGVAYVPAPETPGTWIGIVADRTLRRWRHAQPAQ